MEICDLRFLFKNRKQIRSNRYLEMKKKEKQSLKNSLIYEIKIFDKNGELKKKLSKKKALDLFNFDRKKGRSVYVVTEQERKQFWGRATREVEPKKVVKIINHRVDGRKDRHINKPRKFQYKVVCKVCGKTVMKQSEKAEFCGFKCQTSGSRARQYIRFKQRKLVVDAITFYLKINKAIIKVATSPRKKKGERKCGLVA